MKRQPNHPEPRPRRAQHKSSQVQSPTDRARAPVEKIFLKMPKKRRGLIQNLYLLIAALVFIILFLILLIWARDFYADYKASKSTENAITSASSIKESESLQPTDLVPAVMKSCKDPEINQQLDDFFGPLPKTYADPTYERNAVRGIYCRTPDSELLEHFIQLAQRTEVNALIIDAKESYGLTYPSKVPLAIELGAASGALDWADICRRCHDAGILVIARIVVFKDETMVSGRPDLCIQNTRGEVCHYPMEGGASFVNPYKQESWQYIIDIASELIDYGVDEIQFDYIRFPTGAPEGDAAPEFAQNLKNEELPERHWVINRFLETARIAIQDKKKTPLGADLFAAIMISDIDGFLLGQHWESIGLTGIDNIGVMVYPSHFANNSYHYSGNGEGSQIGDTLFEKPDLEPYAVVKNTMLTGLEGYAQKGYAIMRPYLQAFTASYLPPGYYIEYSGFEIAEQMRALRDVGLREWQLWRPDPDYPEDAFRSPEAENELLGPDPTVNRHQVTIPPATIPEDYQP